MTTCVTFTYESHFVLKLVFCYKIAEGYISKSLRGALNRSYEGGFHYMKNCCCSNLIKCFQIYIFCIVSNLNGLTSSLKYYPYSGMGQKHVIWQSNRKMACSMGENSSKEDLWSGTGRKRSMESRELKDLINDGWGVGQDWIKRGSWRKCTRKGEVEKEYWIFSVFSLNICASTSLFYVNILKIVQVII